MKIVDIKHKDLLNKAAETLKDQGILLFPTDTVYGIGCLMNARAIKRLYEIKNRPLSQPTAVLMTRQQYYHFTCSSRKSGSIIPENINRDFFQGKITIVFPVSILKMKFQRIIIKDQKIGIRLPQFLWLEKLIEKVGPIVASSANKRGKPAPPSFGEIDKEIIEEADLTIRTNEKLPGIPSKVYDLENKTFIR